MAVAFILIFLLICIASVGLLVPQLGQDFFPSVDSGAFKIHVRAHTGMRIEETAALCDHIDNAIRERDSKPRKSSASSTTLACLTLDTTSPTRPPLQ